MWTKEMYLSSLSNPRIRDMLRAFLDLDLQQLQAKALDLDAIPSGGSLTSNHEPNRENRSAYVARPGEVRCDKCKWYFNPKKGEACRCVKRNPYPKVQEA
jgi:hypothetical protein